MSKKKKVLLILFISIILIAAAVFTVSYLKKKNKESKVANVYSVSEIGYYGYYDYEDMLYGNVTATNEQKVYLSSNQQISKVLVREGDQVKIGDVLLIYDTTAQNLQLQTMATEVELARVAVLVAERELEELKNTTPVEETTEAPVTEAPTTEAPTTETPTTEEPTTEAPTTEAPTTEEPTTEEPITEGTPTDASTEDTTTETPTTEEPTTEVPTTEEPTTEEPTTEAPTTEAPTTEEPIIDGDDLSEPEEITYTEKELKQAIKDKEAELSQLRIAYQLIQISYEIMELQTATGELICTCNGVVRQVNDMETAIANNEPFIVVGQTEGYVVETAIGELKLDEVSIGDTLTMMCYDDGMTYTGVITEISDIPYDESYYGDGSQSYYPMTVSVMDAENLTMGTYMEMYLDAGTEEGGESLYLSAAFVKYENGGYYVYKDVNGVLEKCPVSVGAVSYGDLEIVGGISSDDYIAFPYSADVSEGVKTKVESIDKLYY